MGTWARDFRKQRWIDAWKEEVKWAHNLASQTTTSACSVTMSAEKVQLLDSVRGGIPLLTTFLTARILDRAFFRGDISLGAMTRGRGGVERKAKKKTFQ